MAHDVGADVLQVRLAALGLLHDGADVAEPPLEGCGAEDGVGTRDLPGGVGNGLGLMDGKGYRQAVVEPLRGRHRLA